VTTLRRRAVHLGALAVAAALLPSSAFANEAQWRICRAGLNLGMAEARLEMFGRASGGGLPPEQATDLLTNIGYASAEIGAAEALFEEPFSTRRASAGTAGRLASRLASFGAETAGQPYFQRSAQVRSIYTDYRSSLAITFVSSRPDAYQQNKTCDSLILDYCYHHGRAIVAATVDEHFARAYQSGAHAGMRVAKDDGLAVAMDAGSHRPFDGHRQKICCNFGAPGAWEALAVFQPTSPASLYASNQPVLLDMIKTAVPLDPVCGSGEHSVCASSKVRTKWAAFAVSAKSTGVWGRSWDNASRKEAEAGALGGCRKHESDCAIRGSFTSCAAYATAPDGSSGFNWRPEVDAAKRAALASCGVAGHCQLEMTFCADGSNRWKRDRKSETTAVVGGGQRTGGSESRTGLPDLRCPSPGPGGRAFVANKSGYLETPTDSNYVFYCYYMFDGDANWGLSFFWHAPESDRIHAGCGKGSWEWGDTGHYWKRFNSKTRHAHAVVWATKLDFAWASSFAEKMLRQVEPYAKPCR